MQDTSKLRSHCIVDQAACGKTNIMCNSQLPWTIATGHQCVLWGWARGLIRGLSVWIPGPSSVQLSYCCWCTTSLKGQSLRVEAELAVCGCIYRMKNEQEPTYCGINSLDRKQQKRREHRESGGSPVEELKTYRKRNALYVLEASADTKSPTKKTLIDPYSALQRQRPFSKSAQIDTKGQASRGRTLKYYSIMTRSTHTHTHARMFQYSLSKIKH